MRSDTVLCEVLSVAVRVMEGALRGIRVRVRVRVRVRIRIRIRKF